MKTKKLVIDAMLAAMCAVLGYIALDMGNLKVTFESLPILLGALLFGPADGLLIGLIGTTIYQFFRYSISVTTVLWIAPYVIAGFSVGYAAKKRGFALNRKQITALVALSELFITLFNTLTLYIDSKIFGYYIAGYIAGSLLLRLAICAGKCIAFSAILPQLIHALRRRGGHSYDI